jgi:hypothetical protein
VARGDTTSDPKSSTLYGTLRKTCGLGGTMPKAPSDFAFAPDDLKRITAWTAAGAPNN